MKRWTGIIASALIFVLSAGITAPVYAYTAPDTVRVGLEFAYKEVSSIPIGNSRISVGTEYRGAFYPETIISAQRSFTVTVPSGRTVDANEYYNSYDKALDAAEDIQWIYDYDAVPVLVERDLWGVYICQLSESEARSAAGDVGGSVISSNKLMVLMDGNNVVMAFDRIEPQFESTSGYMQLGARSYRGVIELGRYNGGNITAVNVVNLDEYLYGVVPSEMPSSWHIEALKAQAVAARSYTLTRMGVHSSDGYDVCDGTNCQVYIGVTQEKDATTKAVDATSGVLALYNNAPINAVFFSSSGGSTDNGENVWANTIAYLKAVPEINETGGSEWTRTYTADELGEILAGKGINVGQVQNMEITAVGAYGRVQEITITGTSGTKVLTKEETRTLFSGTSEGSLGSRMFTINGAGSFGISYSTGSSSVGSSTASTPLEKVYAYSNQEGGSLTKMKDAYVISSGQSKVSGSKLEETYVIAKGGTLTNIGTASTASSSSKSSSSGSSAKGDWDKVIRYEPSGDTVSTFVISGKGLGHGVGMSQYGAKGMAEIGYKYDEILKYYYTGITVE